MGQSSILDFTVVENGRSKETEDACAADEGTTDRQPDMDSQVNRRDLSQIGAVGNCADGE